MKQFLDINWTYKVNDTHIYWSKETNGGGTQYIQAYFDYFKKYHPNKTFNHALDWCSGVGFLGLGMLACDVCNHITLLEKFEPACDLMHKTIKDNNIDNATAVHNDNVAILKDNYDLIIGNPPQFRQYHYLPTGDVQFNSKEDWIRLAIDKNWNAHREFFTNIKNKMAPDCVILLTENSASINSIAQVAQECGFAVKNKHFAMSGPDHYARDRKGAAMKDWGEILFVEFVLSTP